MTDQNQHPRPDTHPVRLVYRAHAPPGEVFWDPDDIKQHQRRRLEEEHPTRDEIALDRLQMEVEKEFATECTRCRGRAGSYRCGDCHQRTHQIDGMLDFSKEIAIHTFLTRTRYYRSRLNHEEILTQQRKKFNQELRRKNEEARQRDKAAAESLGQAIQTAYSATPSTFGPQAGRSGCRGNPYARSSRTPTAVPMPPQGAPEGLVRMGYQGTPSTPLEHLLAVASAAGGDHSPAMGAVDLTVRAKPNRHEEAPVAVIVEAEQNSGICADDVRIPTSAAAQLGDEGQEPQRDPLII